MVDMLITGVYGQLGQAVERLARQRGLTTAGCDVDTLDIRDPVAVSGLVSRFAPRSVVNCAASTAVDDCEADEHTATAVNGTAVGHLAAACNATGALLVQLSTDYVFDGTGTVPYLESDPVAPASAYGRSKLQGERLASTATRHLIVRTAWLYGHGGRNFVEAIRRQIDGGAASLRVVADQHGNPTFCDDLASALLDLIAAGAGGIVHAVNTGTTTWCGFAQEIVRLLGAGVVIEPVTTSDYPRPARRPPYSALDTTRLATVIGRRMPPWQDALARYLEGPCAS
jgi:dTDP-4-dehydrorhamnose reductase